MKERGDSQTRQYNNLTVNVWQDNKVVSMAATNGDPTMNVQVLRKKKDGTRTPVNCPQSISLYKKFMGGVDHNDQLRGYYHVRLKCRKYYKYIFWFLFDVAVINSYILSRHYTPQHQRCQDVSHTACKGFDWRVLKSQAFWSSSHMAICKAILFSSLPCEGFRESSSLSLLPYLQTLKA